MDTKIEDNKAAPEEKKTDTEEKMTDTEEKKAALLTTEHKRTNAFRILAETCKKAGYTHFVVCVTDNPDNWDLAADEKPPRSELDQDGNHNRMFVEEIDARRLQTHFARTDEDRVCITLLHKHCANYAIVITNAFGTFNIRMCNSREGHDIEFDEDVEAALRGCVLITAACVREESQSRIASKHEAEASARAREERIVKRATEIAGL